LYAAISISLLLLSVFAISKGMQAVKLCSNKILQFLTGGVSPDNGHKIILVLVVVIVELVNAYWGHTANQRRPQFEIRILVGLFRT